MAITVFDGVGKFTADTSQLDQFIVKLEQGLTSASDKAAASTRALKVAQDEFRSSIKAVSEDGGNTAANMTRLADAENQLALASQASRVEHANLKISLGNVGDAAEKSGHGFGSMRAQLGLLDNVMRGNFAYALADVVRGLSQFSIVTAVLPWAAMAAGLVLAGGLWGKLSEQVQEYLDHEKEVQEAIKQMGLVETQTFRDIGDEILREQIKIDDFTGNHLKALQEELELIDHSSMKELEQTFDQLQKKADETFKAMHVGWLGVLLGDSNAGLEQAQKELDDFVKKYNDLLKGGDRTGAQSALTAEMYKASDALATFREQQKSVAAELLVAQQSESRESAGQLSLLKQQKDTLDNEVRSYEFLIDRLKTMVTVQGQINTLEDKRDENEKNAKGTSRTDSILQNQIALGSAVIELLKQQALQRVDTEEQGYSVEKAATKAAFAEQLDAIATLELQKRAIETKAADDLYRLQLKTLQEQLAVAEAGGQKTIADQTRIAAQIEALQFKHQATLIQTWNKAMESLRQTMSQPIPLINETPPGLDTITNDVTEAFDKAEEAAQGLGITLRSDLNENLQRAYDNYAKLTDLMKTGAVTEADAKNGYIALVKAELDFAQATGATSAQIAKLQKQLDELTGKDSTNLAKFGRQTHATFAQFVADLKNGVSGIQELEAFGIGAFDSLADAMQSAIASAILGQESFGQAMEKATAQALASLAAQALVKALFYTAEGFAALASFDFSGAAQFFEAAGIMGAVGGAAAIAGRALAGAASSGSTSTAKPAANGPAGTAAPAPTGGLNAPHLGDGGVLSQRMLAMLGDDPNGSGNAPEAVIPLNDPRAGRMIANALLPGFEKIIVPGLLSRGTVAAASGSFTPVSTAATRAAMRDVFHSVMHDVQVGVTVHSDVPQLVKEINRGVATKKVKLRASNSDRLTRTS